MPLLIWFNVVIQCRGCHFQIHPTKASLAPKLKEDTPSLQPGEQGLATPILLLTTNHMKEKMIVSTWRFLYIHLKHLVLPNQEMSPPNATLDEVGSLLPGLKRRRNCPCKSKQCLKNRKRCHIGIGAIVNQGPAK